VQPVVTTVQQTTAPVLTAVAQITPPVLAAVDQVAAAAAGSPLVEQALQTATQVVAPIVDETGQVLQPVAKATEQVHGRLAASAERDGVPLGGPVQDPTTSTREPGSVGGPTQQSGVVGPARETADTVRTSSPASQTSPFGRRHASSRADQAMPAFPLGLEPLVPTQDTTLDTSSSPRHTSASPAPAPRPFAPGAPFGFFATTAAGGASFFVPLFAVVAAIFLLAAQGVGRRLRPTKAPPQLPILALSLERPG